ncbi:MAG: hypothetical protein HKN36_00830 [Hellea sp.]|nr:hypothetical protein [Hellea sp.]
MGKLGNNVLEAFKVVAGHYSAFHERLLGTYEEDTELQFRAANLFYIILAGYSVIFCLLLLFLFGSSAIVDQHARTVFVPVFTMISVTFAYCINLIIKQKLNLSRSIVLGLAIIAVVSSISLTGGFPKSVASVAIFIPVVMSYCLYGGRTSHSISALLTICLITQWILIERFGIQFPDYSSVDTPESNMALTIGATLMIACFALAVFDISNRKYIQKANAAFVSKTNFLANTSHEIRTPMNGIIGMTEVMMRTTELDRKQKIYMEAIHKSGNALMTIINDILEYSRLEVGHIEIQKEQFNLFKLTQELQTLMAVDAARNNVEVRLNYSDNLTHLFIGDAARIRQVLINLLGNAFKFTQNGYVQINVSSDFSDKKSRVRIEVEDSGIGIAAQKLPKIFEKFTQADSGTTQKYGGFGLGLSISQKLVELMQGQIGVRSELNVGSTFWFTLPLRAVNPVAATAQIHKLPMGPDHCPPNRQALIVSRDLIIVEQYGNFLRAEGFRVFHTSTNRKIGNWLGAIGPAPDRKPLLLVDGALNVQQLAQIKLVTATKENDIEIVLLSPRLSVGYNPSEILGPMVTSPETLLSRLRTADQLIPEPAYKPETNNLHQTG